MDAAYASCNAERGGNAIEAIFLGFNWMFRLQDISDHGIDAQVEVYPFPRLAAVSTRAECSFRSRCGYFLCQVSIRKSATVLAA